MEILGEKNAPLKDCGIPKLPTTNYDRLPPFTDAIH